MFKGGGVFLYIFIIMVTINKIDMKKVLLVLAVILFPTGTLFAQTSPPESVSEVTLQERTEQSVVLKKDSYFSLRTNRLYDAFLILAIGADWRMSDEIGVKLDVGFSHWGAETGKVQKILFLNPEVRWYLGTEKKFYVGIGGNYGKYNTYGYLLGSFYSETVAQDGYIRNTGYQGSLWNVGVTAGYQLKLIKCLSLDFNLGLGCTSFKYDSFNMIERVRIYNKKDQTKKFWGPTQAGVSLVWAINAKK